jgi:putative transcriptional regulator
MPSTARRLLVSVPTLGDPNFFRSVVFMIEHNDDGALGVVLNQPSMTTVEDVLERWAPIASPPGVVFVGGPVQQQEAFIGLAQVATVDASDAWQPLIGAIGSVDLGREPDDAHRELDAVRVFAGYSGWAPGQLDAELDAGGWFVVDARPDDLLTPDPSGLWRTVLRRHGGDAAVSANYPLGEGPGVN